MSCFCVAFQTVTCSRTRREREKVERNTRINFQRVSRREYRMYIEEVEVKNGKHIKRSQLAGPARIDDNKI